MVVHRMVHGGVSPSERRRRFDDFIEITKDHQALFQIAPSCSKTGQRCLPCVGRQQAGSRVLLYNNTRTHGVSLFLAAPKRRSQDAARRQTGCDKRIVAASSDHPCGQNCEGQVVTLCGLFPTQACCLRMRTCLLHISKESLRIRRAFKKTKAAKVIADEPEGSCGAARD